MKINPLFFFIGLAICGAPLLIPGSASGLHRDIPKNVNNLTGAEGSGDVTIADTTVEYCLTYETEPPADRELSEIGKFSWTFPIYGSREDRAVKPSGVLFTYNGKFDSKVEVSSYNEATRDNISNCILVPVSEIP